MPSGCREPEDAGPVIIKKEVWTCDSKGGNILSSFESENSFVCLEIYMLVKESCRYFSNNSM